MRTVHLLAAVAVLALAPFVAIGAAQAEPIVIDHVTVVEGDGPVLADQTVVVDGERIARVVPSAIDGHPAGHHIDGTGKWLMPGLMDMHTHLSGAFDPTKPAGSARRSIAPRASASWPASSTPITAIYDAGNVPELILPLRADERAGKILSPRIFATGNLVTYPGSHGAAIAVTIDSWPAGKATLEKYFAEQHPDIAKITLEEEGWGARPMIPLLPEDLLQDIIQFDNLQRRALPQSTCRASCELKKAIYAGTDTLAHPVIQGPVSDSFVKLMAAKRIPFATTLTIGENYGRLVDHPEFLDTPLYVASFSPQEREWMRTKQRDEFRTTRKVWEGYMNVMTPVAEDNIRKVDAAGGVGCLGTDESSGASTHRELELLVQAGIKPLEVLKIATYNCGLFLGREEDFGSVRAGRFADLLLLNADPTVDVDNTEKIVFVMKAGQIVDEAKLPLPGGKVATRPGPR